MDATKHDITTLFKQLGLPSRDSEIDAFIEQNGDWSEVIDELGVGLRQ
ncbi:MULTISPECIES: DUF2789 family protein [unclassified Pseudoalteromonas]|nr:MULTISPECIES: DUF2789 family protein [unclassified Pseudoalteromonas]MDN3377137.1 DUF2789 family protein [Pseudoalteromonas sp. APC 3893]MDN3385695.1 DUF2789 family protein [Pseudoalteromonas sp. APC 4017]OUS73193.1 hypothetical protein B5G52_05695 [Pseudoalteromonas sp. A601]